MKISLIAIFLFFVTQIFSQTIPAIDIPLSVGDGTSNQVIHLGIDPTATYGLNSSLDEHELPPLPPGGALDVRLVNDSNGLGAYKDFRNGDFNFSGTHTHRVDWQLPNFFADSVIFSWSGIPSNAISIRIRDIITGTLVDTTITGSGTFESNSGFSKFRLDVTYNLIRSDVNYDTAVDMADILLIYNTASNFLYVRRYDLNHDGYVDNADVLIAYGDL